MADPPVIEDTYRVTWNFLPHAGITPRVVQHYYSPGSNKLDFGTDFVDSVREGIFGCMHAGFEPLDVDILPLDGVSPTFTKALDPPDPLCEGGGQILPSSAFLLTLQTEQRGSQGRGRSFIGPCTEETAIDGRGAPDTVAYMQGRWVEMLTLMASLDPLITLTVASYVHLEQYPVSGVLMSPILATMRRRQNQLRS